MSTGEIFLEILKLVGPAALVLGAFALFLAEDRKKKEATERQRILQNTFSHIIPLRLQAYERLIIYMERISPDSMMMRADAQGKTARLFQMQLTAEIREEFNHNIAQQLYVDEETWMEVVRAKEQVIAMVNAVGKTLPPDAPAIELAKRVLNEMVRNEEGPTHKAVEALRSDVRGLFRF